MDNGESGSSQYEIQAANGVLVFTASPLDSHELLKSEAKPYKANYLVTGYALLVKSLARAQRAKVDLRTLHVSW